MRRVTTTKKRYKRIVEFIADRNQVGVVLLLFCALFHFVCAAGWWTESPPRG